MIDSYAKYLVPYEVRVKLPDGDEKWSTIGDCDINILWTRHHEDGFITHEVLHTPGWDAETGKQYCQECHSEMHLDEDDVWQCPECGNNYPQSDVDDGTVNCPTEEASYDWENIYPDPYWDEDD